MVLEGATFCYTNVYLRLKINFSFNTCFYIMKHFVLSLLLIKEVFKRYLEWIKGILWKKTRGNNENWVKIQVLLIKTFPVLVLVNFNSFYRL